MSMILVTLQPQDLLHHAGIPMVPVETPPQVSQKPVEKTTMPLRAMNVFNSVNASDLLKCCMEDDELKHLLEDPLDAAFEGLVRLNTIHCPSESLG